MKFSGYLRLLLAVSFLINQASFAENKQNQSRETQPKVMGSKEVLLEGMDNPIINKVFHNVQLRLLQTPTDSAMLEFFKTNSVFQPLYSFLVQHNDALLAHKEMTFKSDMVQIVRGLTPQYDLLDKLVVDVASSLGFTREAIGNRQIYVTGGGDNAFTVSGSQKKIIVVFQRGILRTMTRSEIAGVLAHELGHIRAEHTVKGIMNYVTLQLIGELFTKGKISLNVDADEFKRGIRNVCEGVCVHSKEFTSQLMRMGAHANNSSVFLKGGNKHFIDQKVQEFAINFANLPKVQLESVVADYLRLAVTTAHNERAPVQTVQYFNTLLKNVGNIGTFRVSPQEYEVHAQMLDFAFSRAKETTADQISASVTRQEYIASAFSKLLGLDFDKEYRPQIFEQIKKQAQEILTTVPPQQLAAFVGTTHPSLALRIDNILEYPSYPSILFANNFLRLLLLNDSLMSLESQKVAELRSIEAQMQEGMQELEAEQRSRLGDKATEKDLKSIEDILNQTRQKLAEAKKTVESQLSEIRKSQLDHEARIFNLLFKTPNLRADSQKAPRMDNTIQYLSLKRELMFINANNIKDRISAVLNQPQTEQTKLALKQLGDSFQVVLSQLEIQQDFIERLKTALNEEANLPGRSKNNLKKRYLLLERILRAQSTDELERVRNRVTGINPNLRNEGAYRRNKISVRASETNVPAPIVPVRTEAKPAASNSGTQNNIRATCRSLFQ